MATDVPGSGELPEIVQIQARLIGTLIDSMLNVQIRLEALEELLAERGVVSQAEWTEAAARVEARMRSEMLVESLLDPRMQALATRLRRRAAGS
jgi:hypothetical protein